MENASNQLVLESVSEMDAEAEAARNWSMAIHLSQFAHAILPLGGIIIPFLIWQFKKKDYPILSLHAKVVINWQISLIVYTLLITIPSLLLVFATAGADASPWLQFLPIIFVWVGMGSLMVASIYFYINGAIQARKDIVWEYPCSMNLFDPRS